MRTFSGQSTYRMGEHVFVVVVQRGMNGRGYEAESYRLSTPRAELVLTPNGSPAASSAPTVWQAVGRMVRLVEQSLGPATEVGPYDLETYSRDGTWQLANEVIRPTSAASGAVPRSAAQPPR